MVAVPWRIGIAWTLLAAACGDAAAPYDGATTTAPTAESTTTAPGPTTTDTAPEPVCCGCLCLDPLWSCAADTCLHADGTAAALAPEAGFLALPAYTYASVRGDTVTELTTPEARMWYAFRPADERPEDRPLAVFFNGGPGHSSAVLFGLNTNAVTLDPDVAGPQLVAANPHSWTRFANVLYLDPRQAGYSYDLAPAVGDPPQLWFSPDRDAADFVRVLLAFLARHPQIHDNPVVLVGESYGGTRAAVMLDQILFPDTLLNGRHRDPSLRAALLEHFHGVFPDTEDPGPSRIAEQFGHQVHIQPAVTWLGVGAPATPDDQQAAALGCIPDGDTAQCDEPPDWPFARARAATAALTSPPTLAAALGVDPTTIAWMHADARAAALPRGPHESPHDESGLRATFGELAPGEQYYYPWYAPGETSASWQDGHYLLHYLETFYYTRVFITDAGKDMVVYSPDIPAHLAADDHIVASAIHDTAPAPGEARPGWIRLTYTPAVAGDDRVRDLRFPHYEIGGHMVTIKQPGEFADDVCRWLSPNCPLP